MSCPDCFRGSAHDEAKPAGSLEIIQGVRTYVSPQPHLETSPRSTIILITDAFGFNLPNTQLLADYYSSKTGYRVLVPDIIPGGGVPLYSLDLMNTFSTPVKWWDIRGQLWRAIAVIRMMSIFIPFAIRTRGAFPSILAYTRGVKSELPTAKLGVAGFCWGGLQTIKLSQEAVVENGESRLVDAHFTAHPAGIKGPAEIIESLKRFKVPFSMAIGDQDFVLSKDVVLEIEAGLRTSVGGDDSHQYEVKIYESCSHGFAVRADPNKTVENEAAMAAADQAVNWFKRFLS